MRKMYCWMHQSILFLDNVLLMNTCLVYLPSYLLMKLCTTRQASWDQRGKGRNYIVWIVQQCWLAFVMLLPHLDKVITSCSGRHGPIIHFTFAHVAQMLQKRLLEQNPSLEVHLWKHETDYRPEKYSLDSELIMCISDHIWCAVDLYYSGLKTQDAHP